MDGHDVSIDLNQSFRPQGLLEVGASQPDDDALPRQTEAPMNCSQLRSPTRLPVSFHFVLSVVCALRTPTLPYFVYSCSVTQGQPWLNQCTLDVLVILFNIRSCTLDVLVIPFGIIND